MLRGCRNFIPRSLCWVGLRVNAIQNLVRMLRLTSGQWQKHVVGESDPLRNDNSDDNNDDDELMMMKTLAPIIYQSDSFVVVDKRYDVKINSDDQSERFTVAKQLSAILPDAVDHSTGHGFRLDYATSGCLCVALTKKAARWGHKAFAQRYVLKHYVALLRGHLDSESQRSIDINVPIGRDVSCEGVYKMCAGGVDYSKLVGGSKDGPVADHREGGSENGGEKSVKGGGVECVEPRCARTRLVLLEHGLYAGDAVSKVLLIPLTGRTHQLRVHCLHVGHPVVGDYTYSGRKDCTPYRMMLHALRLYIPMKRETIDITTPDPFVPERDPLWTPTVTFQQYSAQMGTELLAT